VVLADINRQPPKPAVRPFPVRFHSSTAVAMVVSLYRGMMRAKHAAGDTVLRSPESDPSKAHAYLNEALAVARRQQAKSWELRAAMSMARLWRD
jgi:hypothetical protein